VCCRSCKHGEVYSDYCERQKNRLGWLVVLLRRRKLPEDIALAEAIQKGVWP